MNNQVYEINPIDYRYIHNIVILHLDYLETDFNINLFSIRLLNYYYRSLVKLKENITFYSIVDNDTIAGYICLIKSLKNIYFQMIYDYNIFLLLDYIAYMLSQHKISYRDMINKLYIICNKKKVNSNYFNFIDKIDHKSYELRPIVIAPKYRGTTLARLLVKRAEQELLAKGENRYFLRVYRTNQRAINFYTKLELKIVGTEGSDTLIMEKIIR